MGPDGRGAGLVVSFLCLYLLPALVLGRDLRQLRSALGELRSGADPSELPVTSEAFRELWWGYCETLFAEKAVDESGLAVASRYRATVPAATYFNSNTIADARLSAEFFRHLPSLLTGLGIIGTFNGLITGLGKGLANTTTESGGATLAAGNGASQGLNALSLTDPAYASKLPLSMCRSRQPPRRSRPRASQGFPPPCGATVHPS